MISGFFINRLRRMSPAEILFRVVQKLQTQTEKALYNHYYFDRSIVNEEYKLFSIPVTFKKDEDLIRKADHICEGRFNLFALTDFKIQGPIDYHRDYKSGRSAPKELFGKSINYRDSEKIGDIKYIWELNRHLFLVPLALAYRQTKEVRYLERFEQLLSEWLQQNPFMLGVNWSSSLELGIRLINWTICWHILGDDIKPELSKRWLDSVYQHCWFINRNLSRFSSANNHLIGEVAGLFVASVAMPRFKASKNWGKKAYRILTRESRKQNYPDGVNREQAISYQQFVLDFLLISGLAGEANQVQFPTEYWHVIERMLTYLAALEDAEGNLPQIGDEDDGYVVDLLQKEIGAYRSLLNTGAVLFKRKELFKATDEDYKTSVLLNLGGIHRDGFRPKTDSELRKALPDSFQDGGYYILGTDFYKSTEQKLIFDCGSLGYLSLAAHGHADALSFNFSAGGSRIFIDPGTFAYHADQRWRNYFRSTAAHNTVRVDGLDQSNMAGNFMWSSKAEAKMIEHDPYRMVKGTHDGYKRLKKGVLHVRKVQFIQEQDIWEIEDVIIGEGRHYLELFFHLHPDCRIEEKGEMQEIHFDKGICRFETDKNLDLQIFRGSEEIPLGWYSPSYDVKVPTTTIKLCKYIDGSVKAVTRFAILFQK